MKKDYTKPEMTITHYMVKEYLNNGNPPISENNKCKFVGDGGDCAQVHDDTKLNS